MPTPTSRFEMPGRRRCAAAGLALLLAGAVGTSPAAAADARQSAKGKRVVVSPRPGQVIRSHRVRVRVRSRDLPGVLRVRLNGVDVSRDFGPAHRGVQTLRMSVSHGLRPGKNVLRVRVPRGGAAVRRATVRFVVRTSGPLTGAGRNRRIVVGRKHRLRGRVVHPATGVTTRWRLVAAPRRSGARRAIAAGAAGVGNAGVDATLSRPEALTPGFRPDALGTYTLRLTAGSGDNRTSDLVKLNAVPRSPLVPVDTMAGDAAKPGIRVGGAFYPLPETKDEPEGSLQLLVLDRATLGLVSNEAYRDTSLGSPLIDRLRDFDDTKLVVLAQQPHVAGGGPYVTGDRLALALKWLGHAGDTHKPLPPDPGAVSAIGFVTPAPSTHDGDADVAIATACCGNDGERPGRMRGYLTPDQDKQYGFLASERIPFSYGIAKDVPCAAGDTSCENAPVGFRVRHLNPYNRRPGSAIDGQVYNTGGRTLTAAQQSAEAARMSKDLDAVGDGELLVVETVSNRKASERYVAPVGVIDRATMVKLAESIKRLGGTRHAFNTAARATGQPAGGGSVYTLVGWAGAGEGAGTEAAVRVDGAGDKPSVSGILRRDHDSRFRPAEVTRVPTDAGALADLILEPPSHEWPLDDDPGALKALAYLLGGNNDLVDRSAYWTQPFQEARWYKLAGEIRAVEYPEDEIVDFTPADFKTARAQLFTELNWVGKVRGYLAELFPPFTSEEGLRGWVTAQSVADDIYKSTHVSKDKVALEWVEFTKILLEFMGPATHDISGSIGAILDFGVWAFSSSGNEEPGEELRIGADELGEKLVDQAQKAQATLLRIGDVIVSDYQKLSLVGANAGCNPRSPKCAKEFSFNDDDQLDAEADLHRGFERIAWEKLLPLGYHAVRLLPGRARGDYNVRSAPPNPQSYRCDLSYHPFYGHEYGEPIGGMAQFSLLQELDPAGHANAYETFALAQPPGATTHWATGPSDKAMNTMFRELGISRPDFFRGLEHHTWYDNENMDRANCSWDK